MYEEVIAYIPSLIKAVISLFIVVDPLGNIPIFISLTDEMSKAERKRTFQRATVTGAVLLFFFALLGQQIFVLFGISMRSFMIAGGILLLLIAVKMLVTGEWERTEGSPESIGVVPMAIPLLVGPGAITTTILNIRIFNLTITILSILIVFFAVWVILRFIDPIYKLLGKAGSMVISRVMALIMAAIAVEYILNGIQGIW